MVLQVQVATDIHTHPIKNRVRRIPSIILIIHNLPLQLYLHNPAHIPRAEIWAQVDRRGSAPPVENTPIGGRIAPMTVILILVVVTHMLFTCVRHHQNLPLTFPHNSLFVFTLVVQITGQWSAEIALEITEKKDVHPAQHQAGTAMKNNRNLLWLLVKIHKSPMVS